MQVQRRIIDVLETRVVLELPQSFVNRRVEVIALTMDDETVAGPVVRQPHPGLFGKGCTVGDLTAPIVDSQDWTEAP